MFFRLVDFQIVEKLLEDRINNTLADFDIYNFQLISYIFEVIKVHNIKDYLVINIFYNNFLYIANNCIVFFQFFDL